jgi:hypothetical protein
MSDPIARREALRHLALVCASAAVARFEIACSKKTSCTDVTGLTPDEVTMRTQTAAYVDAAPDPAKKCIGCAQWAGAPSAGACGGCKVVKGPINPDGWCKLWVAKPA